jgi:hypothetical protein
MTTKRMLVLLTAVALMVVMVAMAVGPAFAQTEFNDMGGMTFGGTEFNDIQGVTFGGNCLVNDVVEFCDINTGTNTSGGL